MTEHQSMGVEIYGMRPEGSEAMRAKLSKQLVESLPGQGVGSMDMEGDVIVINDQVAAELGGVQVGDKVTVLAAKSMPEVIGKLAGAKKDLTDKEAAELVRGIDEITLQQTLTVSGILRADTTWGRCYVPLNHAQELFGLGGSVHGVGIELTDPHQAREFVKMLDEKHLLPDEWSPSTWMFRHQSRLAAIEHERIMMWFVLSFVVVVAAFSVLNTTLTVTVQKRREIGILTALGARVSQIVGVFMAQATVVALIGTLLGYLGGISFLHYRNTISDFLGEQFHIEIFPKNIYFLEAIPAHTQPMDVLVVCLVSVALCLIAAFLPAFFAARVDPAVALRD
jgi:lipoprotein-releasing system permease protein